MITSKVSAALFRSRIPSSAFLNRSTNLFVKRPEKYGRNKYDSFHSSTRQ